MVPGQEAATVHVLTLNLLHGFFCPPETDACRAPARVAIFADLLEEADCPALVGLQEIGTRLGELLPPTMRKTCDGAYRISWEAKPSPDRAMVLSRLPVTGGGYLDLAGFPWEAYWVRVTSPAGPVDFLTAHFASSVNNPPCDPGRCPPICPTGMPTNHCNALEVVDFLDNRPPGATLTVVGGDLNATPRSPTLTTFTDAGFVDAWLAAGRPECDPATGVGCTSGGSAPEPFVGMDTETGPGFDERIDYLLVRPAPRCRLHIEADAFAHQPRPASVQGLFWPSDHAGVQATIGCSAGEPG